MIFKQPKLTPLRDAQVGFGLWPWSKGPLWLLTEDWDFEVESDGVIREFTIPAGYKFDKASVPSLFWGFPFNYTPDGLCTVAALEHDFLCDIWAGGSEWLRKRLPEDRLIPVPAKVMHRHFYDRLLQSGVRPSKAKSMYVAVDNFGPGGKFRPFSKKPSKTLP